MSDEPAAIRELADQEERTERALERATAPFPAPEPEAPPTPAQAFTERMAEQRRAEDEREARVQRLMFEHAADPAVALDEPDPFRAFAQAQQAARRRRPGRRAPR